MIEEMKIVDDSRRGCLVVGRKGVKIVFYERNVAKTLNIVPFVLKGLAEHEEKEVLKESSEHKRNKGVEHNIGMLNEPDVSLAVSGLFLKEYKSSHLKIVWLNKPKEKDTLYFDLKELKHALELFKDHPNILKKVS